MKETPLPAQLAAVYRTVTDEFNAWEKTLPQVEGHSGRDPRAEGGLPDGWVIVSHLPNYSDVADLFLTRRTEGGWVIVRYERARSRSTDFWIDTTLGDLHAHVLEGVADGDRFPSSLDVIAGWLRGVLVSLFDPTDPVEAAEQVLAAMGGPLTVLPRLAC